MLTVADMRVAHDKYDSFVDVHFPMLTIVDFVQKLQLPLNEQCASVFFEKTAHLNDNDFIEIDRPILEIIGFKNKFIERKDKNGNIKVDESGSVKLIDMRADFNSAIRCLRNMEGFHESNCFDDHKADFIIKKAVQLKSCTASDHKGGSGHNKQELWLRKRMLEHLVIMANTGNSRIIREYFLDLNHIMTEYNMYQTVYQSKSQLSIKDTTIEKLNNMILSLHAKSDDLLAKNEIQSQQFTQKFDALLNHAQSTETKLTTVIDLVRNTAEDVVVPANDTELGELVIIMANATLTFFTVSCIQQKRRSATIQYMKRQHSDKDLSLFHEMNMRPNSKNLWHRFKEYVRTDADLSSHVSLLKTSFELNGENNDTIVRPERIIAIFEELKQTYQGRAETRINM